MGVLDTLFPSRVRKREQHEQAAVRHSLEVRERENRISTQKEMVRYFTAASEDRRRPNWNAFSLSGDVEMMGNLPIMRARARLMANNDAKAGGIIHKEITNVVGPKITVQARVPRHVCRARGLTDEQVKEITDNAEYYWRDRVALPGNKDFDWKRRYSFLQYIRLIFRHAKVDGGVFVRYLFKPDRSIPFAARIIEPECIGTPPGMEHMRETIRSGVQFKKDGELEGFWVAVKHPFDLSTAGNLKYEFVPIKNSLGLPQMVFYHEPYRETTSREMPWLQKILVLLNDVADYKDSELQRKKAEAEIAWFFTLNDPDAMQAGMETDTAFADNVDKNSHTSKRSKIDHAKRSVYYLEKGEGIDPVNADRPGGNYEAFLDSHDRDIGQGIGRSFERVSNNYGAANFSATRVSGIEDAVEYEIEFNLFAEGILNPAWTWAMWALSMETGDNIYRELIPNWQRYIKPSWDGEKDTKAMLNRVMGGTQSIVEEAARLGEDWEKVQDNRLMVEAREVAERERLGLPPRNQEQLVDPLLVKRPPKKSKTADKKNNNDDDGDTDNDDDDDESEE